MYSSTSVFSLFLFLRARPLFCPVSKKKIPALFISLAKVMMTRMLFFRLALFPHSQIQKGEKEDPGLRFASSTHQLAKNNWILECRSGGASMEDSVGQRWALVC